MAGSDFRVPFAVVLDAFGVPATVTREDADPIETEGVWVLPSMDLVPSGLALQVSAKHRLIAFDRDAVPTLPKGTSIVAPERLGEAEQGWIVEDQELADADHIRALVVKDREWEADDAT